MTSSVSPQKNPVHLREFREFHATLSGFAQQREGGTWRSWGQALPRGSGGFWGLRGFWGLAACSARGRARKSFWGAGSCPSAWQLTPKEAREHLKVKPFRRKRRKEKQEPCGSISRP